MRHLRIQRPAVPGVALRLLLPALFLAFLFTWGSPACVFGQSSDLAGFAFLRLDPSARAASMSGSYTAVGGSDVNGLFYNPALLNEDVDHSLSLSYLNHVAGLNAGFVAYARDVEGIGTLGAGIRYLGYGDLRGADDTGAETGTFGASDVALTVGASRAYNAHLRYGANLHAIYSHIDTYSASALAVDLGVVYHLDGPAITLAASINNLGQTLSTYADAGVALPTDIRISVAKQLRHVPLLLSITGYNLNRPGDVPDDAPTVGRVMQFVLIGGELRFSDAFQIRFGYNHRRHEALATRSHLDLAGLSLGAGIKVSRLRIDYAYSTWSGAGGLHEFTVRTRL
ncbi:MAG TPA: type IX secretion system protein PorQ [Rhodothermales bacterium]|nr:type IX secretion system protein PorQ [Rhodothermales bacterium]